jgi:hypothetical protein
MYRLRLVHSFSNTEWLTFATLQEAELYLNLEVKRGTEYSIVEVSTEKIIQSGKK